MAARTHAPDVDCRARATAFARCAAAVAVSSRMIRVGAAGARRNGARRSRRVAGVAARSGDLAAHARRARAPRRRAARRAATPVAFGAGAELLWRARVGGFAAAARPARVRRVRADVNGERSPASPTASRSPSASRRGRSRGSHASHNDGGGRLLRPGIGLQLGVTVEHLRTSDDNATTAGLHAALAVDVPLYGGPSRAASPCACHGRVMFTPEVNLDAQAPSSSRRRRGQLFAGLCLLPMSRRERAPSSRCGTIASRRWPRRWAWRWRARRCRPTSRSGATFVRALRRRRAAGRAGGAHPGAPRLDARCRSRRCSSG